MYRIAKQFSFSASHQLGGLRDGHPCAQLHGHNYVVEIILAGEDLDGAGMLVDFGKVSSIVRPIIQALDHSHLNDRMEQPTAELIARWLWVRTTGHLPALESVRVWETPECWAEYRG